MWPHAHMVPRCFVVRGFLVREWPPVGVNARFAPRRRVSEEYAVSLALDASSACGLAVRSVDLHGDGTVSVRWLHAGDERMEPEPMVLLRGGDDDDRRRG